MVHPGRQAARSPRHPRRLRLYGKWLLAPRGTIFGLPRFLSYLDLTLELNLDFCRPTVNTCGTRVVHLHNKRVRRTMIGRPIHNIWASRHVTVTYIMDKRPQSLEHWN